MYTYIVTVDLTLILTKATQVKSMPKVELVSGDLIAPLRSGTEGGSPLDFEGSRGIFKTNCNFDRYIFSERFLHVTG